MKREHTTLPLIGAWMVVFLMLSATAASADFERFELELEGGAVWQNRNEVQIPNDETATRFSLVDVIGKGPYPAGRVYFTWNLNERHSFRALAAPLSIEDSGTLGSTVSFAGQTFAPGVTTDAIYQFNSWRIGYRYRFFDSERWTWRIGFTAKIRDAKVELKQGTTTARDTDVGFVPLLYIAGARQLSQRWSVEIDADALAGGPGRAVDAAAKLRYDLSGTATITGGYRVVEGGADVDAVYNFAWLQYAVASVQVRF